jgi:peptidoglycan L-alanyl-D-glutamate endopeptidase CwlK
VKFGVLAGVMLATAKELGIKITWGGYWKSPFDCPHFELTEK